MVVMPAGARVGNIPKFLVPGNYPPPFFAQKLGGGSKKNFPLPTHFLLSFLLSTSIFLPRKREGTFTLHMPQNTD